MNPNIALIKALVMTLGLEVESLNDESDAMDRPINLPEKVRKYEAAIIRAALLKTGGNQRQAAALLNLKTSTLNSKIKQFEINLLHFKPPQEVEAADKPEYVM